MTKKSKSSAYSKLKIRVGGVLSKPHDPTRLWERRWKFICNIQNTRDQRTSYRCSSLNKWIQPTNYRRVKNEWHYKNVWRTEIYL